MIVRTHPVRGWMALVLTVLFAASPVTLAQSNPPADAATPKTQSEIDAAALERLRQLQLKKPADWTAEELAEAVLLVYGGRRQISTVYNTGREEGRITLTTGTGEIHGELARRFVNGPTMSKDRVRMDMILETSPKPEQQLRYTVVYNGASVWAAQNNQYTTPDSASTNAFKASVLNDYTALFRFRDDGAKLARLGLKKISGLDNEVIEMTRSDGSKLQFFISSKSYRILHVEYQVVLVAGQAPVTFRESYSEWQTLQQTLVPGRRKLRQNDHLVQTVDIKTATYGQTFDDSVFLQL